MNDCQKIYFTIKDKDYFNYLKYFSNNKANIQSIYNSNRLSEPLQNNFIAVKQIGHSSEET